MVQRRIVLDDDPTGTQSVSDIAVLLDWTDRAAVEALAGDAALYVSTNTRAADPDEARRTVREVADALGAGEPGTRFILRGDSTLRGHPHEEYLGLVDATPSGTGRGRTPPYVIVPALPSAGRITVDGVHLLERDGTRTRLDRTEYADDPALGYRSSQLLAWAEERSAGHFSAIDGAGLSLADLRDGGPAAVADVIARLADRGRVAAFAPDAVTTDDVALIAAGIELAWADGHHFVVRAGPALAALATGHGADLAVPVATPDAGDGVLVVCGSHVPNTTTQLQVLAQRRPGSVLEADLEALAGEAFGREQDRLAQDAHRLIADQGVAVIATPRALSPSHADLSSSRRIANALAGVLHAMPDVPQTVIAKGGITSAVVAREGLRASRAHARGPLRDGAVLWDVESPSKTHALIIFPGNTGTATSLADLVDDLRSPLGGAR
jgi:uncharacterized protein YgbK (DUF1537 family)